MFFIFFFFTFFFFFFNDTATTEIYTLSLHDALPTCTRLSSSLMRAATGVPSVGTLWSAVASRSEEHTSVLQSLAYLVCRLLLEKKKKTIYTKNLIKKKKKKKTNTNITI